jgi:hypothetical protein
VWHAVVFVGMMERDHADPRLGPRVGMPPLKTTGFWTGFWGHHTELLTATLGLGRLRAWLDWRESLLRECRTT